MDFGAVLQTNPPSARTVQLAKLAEAHGFSHVWTFDSHLLWQEPYVIYSKILAETDRIIVGPMVTNPATRDWTVTASTYATLNEMYGNRTICGIGRGDSAVRVTGGAPTNLKTLRESIHVIRELANSRSVEYNDATLQFPWSKGSELEVWVAAYGPLALKLTGEENLDLFGDIEVLAEQCRFADCGHGSEPGCAVQTALDTGELTAERWRNYLKLHDEREEQAASLEARLRRQRGGRPLEKPRGVRDTRERE